MSQKQTMQAEQIDFLKAAAIAILAALLDPKTAASDNPGPAILRALELIKRVRDGRIGGSMP